MKFDHLGQDGPSEIPYEDWAMHINRINTPACCALLCAID